MKSTKRFAVLLLAVCLVLGLCACAQKQVAATWQGQYDLGVRYLSEGNYEEAIIAFTAAIEIEPKRAEAYLSLADAYMSAGDYENAEAAIERGREACGDAESFERFMDSLLFLRTEEVGLRITNLYFDKSTYLSGRETEFLVSAAYRCPENEDCVLMIDAGATEGAGVSDSGSYRFRVSATPSLREDELFGIYVDLSTIDEEDSLIPFADDVRYIDAEGNVIYGEGSYSGFGGPSLEQGVTDNMVRADEINFLGHSIVGLDINTMESLLWANGFNVRKNGDEDNWWIGGDWNGSALRVTALQYKDEEVVCLWGYSDYGEYQEDLPIGIRDIYTGDSLSAVLTKLGFSNGAEIEALVVDLVGREFSSTQDIYEPLQAAFEGWCDGFGVSMSGSTLRISDNGNCASAEFSISLYFKEMPGHMISFTFGSISSDAFVPFLSHYDVSYHD